MKFILNAFNHHRLSWHWTLLTALIVREIRQRYRGTFLGLLWSLIGPLLQLSIFAFIFRSVFSARWPNNGNLGSNPSAMRAEFVLPEQLVYALNLFIGLMVFSMFSEVMTRSPRLVVDNPQFVRKVVFPLPILSQVTTVAALFHALMYWSVLSICLFLCHVYGQISSGAAGGLTQGLGYGIAGFCFQASLSLLVLLITYPFLLSICWVLAALGAYFRDMTLMMPALTSVMMLLRPVFYPSSALPDTYQLIIDINPISLPINQIRDILLHNRFPEWSSLSEYFFLGCIFAIVSKWFFSKVQRGFPDVI